MMTNPWTPASKQTRNSSNPSQPTVLGAQKAARHGNTRRSAFSVCLICLCLTWWASLPPTGQVSDPGRECHSCTTMKSSQRHQRRHSITVTVAISRRKESAICMLPHSRHSLIYHSCPSYFAHIFNLLFKQFKVLTI